jgi:type IX secretion system PorP/SprF family membrane protein
MRTLPFLLTAILLLPAGLVAQQMPIISQIEENQTFYNPGATGNQEVLTAIFTYRKQWTGFEGWPSSQIFSAHAPLKNPDVALGVVLEHDAIGSTNYTGVFLNYAYRIDLGSNKLSFGLKGGITSGSQKYIETRDETPDPAFSDENSSFYVPNFGIGVLYYGKKFWTGISIPRLFTYENDASDKYHMEPDFSVNQYFLSGGGKFSIGPDLSLDPTLLFIYCPSPSLDESIMLDLSAVYKKALKAGIAYRTGIKPESERSVIMLFSYSMNRQFSLGYSYDYQIGEYKSYTKGSHEFTILYKFGYQVNASNPRQF